MTVATLTDSVQATFGAAVWIGGPHPFDLHEVYLDFRAPAVRGREGDVVQLAITADSRYRLWLNGRLLGRGPERSYPHAQAFDWLDLSDAWETGDNQISVQVYQPGYSHFGYVHRGAAGLLAALIVNGELRLTSDAAWRVRRNPSFADDVLRVSIYGSGVEKRNMDWDDGWQTATSTSSTPLSRSVQAVVDDWSAARIVAEANGAIWRGLRPRTTPRWVEHEAKMTLVASRLSRQGSTGDEPHWELKLAWEAGNEALFEMDDAGWIRPFLTPNQTALWLFDLGQSCTCQGWVDVQNASGSEQIQISYAEKINDVGLVISDPTTYCRVRQTDSFALRAGDQRLEPFGLRGGRYLIFQLTGNAAETLRLRFHGKVVRYPLERSRSLGLEDPTLNQIVSLCEQTMLACLQDSFVDCVCRESSQWLGDGLIQSKTLWSMSEDVRPMQKLLQDTAQGQDAQGMVPSVAPGEVHAYTIPRYGCMWVELLAFYLEVTQDEAFVRQPLIWNCFLRLMTFFTDNSPRDDNGLHITPPGRRHYIDWSPTSQADPHAVYNLHIVLTLQTAACLARPFLPKQAGAWEAEAMQLRTLCREMFWNGRFWQDDLVGSTHSQLAAALALLVGAVAEDEQATLLDWIVSRSLDESDEHEASKMVLASPFMHHYVFEALRDGGRETAVLDIIKLRWGRWVEGGYPTTWENWNVDFPDGSHCHAFSAHPRYHLWRMQK